MQKLAAVLLVAVVGSIVACSSSSDANAPGGDNNGGNGGGTNDSKTGEDGGKPSTAEPNACSLALAYAEAQCSRAERCGTMAANPGYFRSQNSNAEMCSHVIASFYAGIFSMKAAPMEKYAACKAELEAPGCDPTPTCATIGDATGKGVGDSCQGTDNCTIGLSCAKASAFDITGTCAERKADGGACGRSDECAPGLSCQNEVCHAVVANVTECRVDDDCRVEPNNLNDLLNTDARGHTIFACDAAVLGKGKCQTVVLDQAAGAACDVAKVCAKGLYCKGLKKDGHGTCETAPKWGEACDGPPEGGEADGCFSCLNNVCTDTFATRCPK